MALNVSKAILKQAKSALLLCDVQQLFSKHIYEFDKMIINSSKLISATKILNVPMLVTEQVPSKLGKTVSTLDISNAIGPFGKTQFSMYTPEVENELSKICCGNRPESIILIGIEAHVCVENTAIDLIQNGFNVQVVADCCSSRTQEDRLLAFERMKQIGCQIATSENIIFKLMKDTNHKNFKAVQSLLKSTTEPTGLVPQK